MPWCRSSKWMLGWRKQSSLYLGQFLVRDSNRKSQEQFVTRMTCFLYYFSSLLANLKRETQTWIRDRVSTTDSSLFRLCGRNTNRQMQMRKSKDCLLCLSIAAGIDVPPRRIPFIRWSWNILPPPLCRLLDICRARRGTPRGELTKIVTTVTGAATWTKQVGAVLVVNLAVKCSCLFYCLIHNLCSGGLWIGRGALAK